MSATATAPDRAAIPVSVATLLPGTVPGVSLYLSSTGIGSFKLYRAPEHPITEPDLENLRQRGIVKLYVAGEDHRQYQTYLRDNLDHVLESDGLPHTQRVSCLNTVIRDVLGDVFQQRNLDEQIGKLKEFGEKIVGVVCRDGIVLSELRSVMYHDYHTFTHSANVAMYAVMLARALGINERAELSEIATGGLLHDAGKLDIPPAILTKPGRLDDTELRIIRRHPDFGFRKLCHRGDLSRRQLMMVYQHHEQMDGSGYPVHSAGEEIDVWGRICAVADVFEALTSNRPYRAGSSFARAAEMMNERSGTAFDPDILKCWMQFAATT
jgi:HD-GYP domain-containing protein (c-di-GMP phosphodiesterase class II)